jgi:hypothetical protein
MAKPLTTYIRMHRKRSCLTQGEVAYLVGGLSGSTVTRHELASRLPIVDKALCYQIIFGVPVGELYLGVYDRVRIRVCKRAEALCRHLEAAPRTIRTDQKVEHLRKLLEANLSAD